MTYPQTPEIIAVGNGCAFRWNAEKQKRREPIVVIFAIPSAVPARWECPANAPHSPGHYGAPSYQPWPACKKNRLSVSVDTLPLVIDGLGIPVEVNKMKQFLQLVQTFMLCFHGRVDGLGPLTLGGDMGLQIFQSDDASLGQKIDGLGKIFEVPNPGVAAPCSGVPALIVVGQQGGKCRGLGLAQFFFYGLNPICQAGDFLPNIPQDVVGLFYAIQEITVLCRYTRDHNKKATAENLLKKLHELSEDDCKKLICDIQRNYHLPWKARTVGEMIAVARQESGVQKLEGHDIMALERFDPEVTHMIVFDVLSRESPIGDKGERMRLFLTEAGYKKALENQGRSFIRILNHAKVSQGHLRYDRPDGER